MSEHRTERLKRGVLRRARLYAALGDPYRLAIVEALALSDRSPGELGRELRIPSNLLSHHVDLLVRERLVDRRPSAGDRRRRYLRLRRKRLGGLPLRTRVPLSTHSKADDGGVLFVCTHNSARSQLAAALWRQRSEPAGLPQALSAGTRPAQHVHPLALAVAERRGLDLLDAVPRHIEEIEEVPRLVVTVCDEAHEELRIRRKVPRLHWSLPDPAALGDERAFEKTADVLGARIGGLSAAIGDAA